jgi:hypothetical protein
MRHVTITINSNSDDISIHMKEGKKEEVTSFPCKHPNNTRQILETIFNSMNVENLYVTLEYINEDHRESYQW